MEDITLNTLKNAKKSIEQFLLSEGVVSDNYEASSEAAIILCEIHNCKKTDIVFNPDDMLSDEEKSQITDVLSKRKERVPLQYIFGHAPFYGREFKVTPDTLIPRFDTEVLVENAAEVIEAYIKESHFGDNTGNNFDKAANDNVDDDINCADNNFNNTSINILDMCTGTGCIIITLAKELEKNLKKPKKSDDCEKPGNANESEPASNMHFFATDIDPNTLKVAHENAKNLGADVTFIESDMFKSDFFNNKENGIDILVSNPPYITEDVINTLEPEVKNHEPFKALYGGEDGLFFYRIIAQEGYNRIKENGCIMFEVGYDEGDSVSDILNECGYVNVEIIKDLAGMDRVVKAYKSSRHIEGE